MPNGWRSVVPAWSCAGVSSHDGLALIRVGQRPEQRSRSTSLRGDASRARAVVAEVWPRAAADRCMAVALAVVVVVRRLFIFGSSLKM